MEVRTQMRSAALRNARRTAVLVAQKYAAELADMRAELREPFWADRTRRVGGN